MKKLLLTALFMLTTTFSGWTYVLVAAPIAVLAQTPKDAACEGLTLTGAPANCAPPAAGEPSIDSTLTLVINIFSMVVGIAGVIMIMVGGFKYITSSGNDQSVNSAKNTIFFAIIGLVVVALAQVIVRFVINRASDPAGGTTGAPAPGTP